MEFPGPPLQHLKEAKSASRRGRAHAGWGQASYRASRQHGL